MNKDNTNNYSAGLFTGIAIGVCIGFWINHDFKENEKTITTNKINGVPDTSKIKLGIYKVK